MGLWKDPKSPPFTIICRVHRRSTSLISGTCALQEHGDGQIQPFTPCVCLRRSLQFSLPGKKQQWGVESPHKHGYRLMAVFCLCGREDSILAAIMEASALEEPFSLILRRGGLSGGFAATQCPAVMQLDTNGQAGDRTLASSQLPPGVKRGLWLDSWCDSLVL